jgi:signal transduction histidine kinase
MRLSPTTLRARLLLGSSIATACIMLGAGLLIYVLVRASLFAEYDLALNSSLRAVSALTEQNSHGVKLEPEAARIPEFIRKDSPDYYAVFLDDGSVVATSKSLGSQSLSHPVPPPGKPITSAITLPDNQPGRQATLSFMPVFEDSQGHHLPGKRIVTVTVARHIRELTEKLTGLAWLLAGVGAIATLSAAGAMFLVVQRGLRPLSQLAAKIASTSSDNLDQRIELAGIPAELATVVLRLNELLERLQSTFVRERRFTADAAHELRTPLAGLETILDVCATRERPAADYVKTLAKCQRIVRGMHCMVDGLLTLARADGRQLAVTISRVPLAVMVQEAWTTHASAAAAKGLRVSMKIDPHLAADTDAEKLRMIVNNLLDNAVSHSDAKGWVRIEARPAGKRVALSFSNSGSALNEEQVQRAFDRFWRGDSARRDTGLHCGLGLSLCCELTGVLAGEIAATSEPGGVFLVRIVLPNRSPDRSPAPDTSAAEKLESITA